MPDDKINHRGYLLMRKRKALIIKILFALLGIAGIVIAVFAYQLGMDNNADMGIRRKLSLCAGIVLLLLHPLSIGLSRLDAQLGIRRRLNSIIDKITTTRFFRWLAPFLFPPGDTAPGQRRQLNSWIWALGGSAIAIFISLWYITAGTITHWSPYSRYYDRQADAFLAGQLALLEAPPAELATLPDVYDQSQREGIDYIWDASYYNGKYYLYWGPVPALVAAGIKLVKPMVVEDQYLVMLFMSALTLTLAAFFRWIKKSYFPSAPGWTIFLFTLTTALCTPLLFIINRPCVYEAAISSAQFFLVLGLYGAIRAIAASQHKTGWLILAGIGLGAAVCSRFTYLIAVIFISAFLMFMLLKDVLARRAKWVQLLGFIIPISLFAIGLAMFNYARFGRILESGLRYQLTGSALPEDFRLLFSTDYFLPNAYLSLFRPIRIDQSVFPFLFNDGVIKETFPDFIRLAPTYFFSEQIVGAMASIPFLWTLLLPLVTVIKKGFDRLTEEPAQS